MEHHHEVFYVHALLHDLKHYLPAQAPLKDFIHHNTLHAFQHLPFFEATAKASTIFGYRTTLSLSDFRSLYAEGRIDDAILERKIAERKSAGADVSAKEWLHRLKDTAYPAPAGKRMGSLRHAWKQEYHVDLNAMVHPDLFRILNSYLDQGIAIWRFPNVNGSFLENMRALERNSLVSIFHTQRAKALLLDAKCSMSDLLMILVGDESLYAHYVFDQQFSHPGWSGMVSNIEGLPQGLLDRRNITLEELIMLELMLEIDRLDATLGEKWAPLGTKLSKRPKPLFDKVTYSELHEVLALWQEAFEWTYHDQVLAGINQNNGRTTAVAKPNFQALFCIDDRECSIRRHLEKEAPGCATYGTPGHFGIPTYYRPEHGKFNTKICPAPVAPKHLIKELGAERKNGRDMHFTRHTHGLVGGWLITHTIGFWSALRLLVQVFKPSTAPAKALSAQHMSAISGLTVEHTHAHGHDDGLQVGFTVAEMTDIVRNVLMSIGLNKDFASLVYLVGHGSSSVNNTHYAGYDCGACSGRPGSVNARAFSIMANHAEVRKALATTGIEIPDSTRFVGALHDTSRDEISFFDTDALSGPQQEQHLRNASAFNNALDRNAKERSRRFELIASGRDSAKVHDRVRIRTVSLFEPRPELNHATNALCIVGRREMTHGLFLDRRSFLNSYDHRLDADGTFLLSILKAAAPVCGGINLEYFFSRVDNHKLGAGTKLPHNVMGLIGVANGIGGDLRPGLPSQMIEVHDPIRLLLIVEHYADVVLETIQRSPETYEWFANQWVHLAVIHPETREASVFSNGKFHAYAPLAGQLKHVANIDALIATEDDNLPVMLLENA
jgi:uncharacterized protein YbcC (UPF0753/DUF2309 family)